MNCLWEDVPKSKDARGWRKVRCTRYGCGKESNLTPHPHEKIYSTCRAPSSKDEICKLMSSPGSRLAMLIHSLGQKPDNCDGSCKEMIVKMNDWGIEGCREHRVEIVKHLNKAYKKMTTREKFMAAAGAWEAGLGMKINPLDITGSLVDIAIERSAIASRS